MAFFPSIKHFLSTTTYLKTSCRFNSHHKKVRRNPKRFVMNAPLKGRSDSLSSRGFMRHMVSYQPSEDANDRILKCFETVLGTTESSLIVNIDQKFKILSALNREFSYIVPNSFLYKMKTLGDIFEYYVTPVDVQVPFEHFKKMDLPPNLHIMYDYNRFNPQADTKFGGISAFPRTSNLVTGIKWKKKYTGFTAEPPWMDI